MKTHFVKRFSKVKSAFLIAAGMFMTFAAVHFDAPLRHATGKLHSPYMGPAVAHADVPSGDSVGDGGDSGDGDGDGDGDGGGGGDGGGDCP